jgi:hypothetical protein
MTWDELQKPFIGGHWWYWILTGRKYSFPFMKQDGYKVYWKVDARLPKYQQKPIECKLLNWIFYLECKVNKLRRKLYER